MMKRLLGLLIVVGLMVGMSGCGGEVEEVKETKVEVEEVKETKVVEVEEVKETKVWTLKYENQTIKEEYQYYNHPETNRRIKDGWYNSYYENGEYKEIGRHKEDVRDGEWTFFTRHSPFLPSLIYGRETKGIYKDGKTWSGEFVSHYVESGEVLFELHYVDGKLEGKSFAYDKDGEIFTEMNYVDGKKEGKEVYYVGSGRERRVSWEVTYVDGEGKYVGYYESGKVRREGNYVDDKKEGKWVGYDEEGNIWDVDIYKDGECIEMCEKHDR